MYHLHRTFLALDGLHRSGVQCMRVCVYVCVCVCARARVCAHVCVVLHVHMWDVAETMHACMYVEAREGYQMSCSITPHLIPLSQGLSLNLELG